MLDEPLLGNQVYLCECEYGRVNLGHKAAQKAHLLLCTAPVKRSFAATPMPSGRLLVPTVIFGLKKQQCIVHIKGGRLFLVSQTHKNGVLIFSLQTKQCVTNSIVWHEQIDSPREMATLKDLPLVREG